MSYYAHARHSILPHRPALKPENRQALPAGLFPSTLVKPRQASQIPDG